MREHWRPVLPPSFVTGLLCILYVLSYFIDVLLLGLFPRVPREVPAIRVILLILAAILYAYYRVRTFHPFYNRSYREWLCVIPWSVDQPLPRGPIHLIWVDLIIVGVLALLAYSNLSYAALMPVIAFLIVYLALLLLTFEADQIHIPAIALFLAPFAIYPSRNVYVGILVLLALYVLCLWGLQQYMKDFPWNTKYWKADPVKEFVKQATRQHVIGWPFKYLNIYQAPKISVRAALVLSILLTWWLHVIRWTVDKPYHLALLLLFACLAALVRTMTYIGTYWPPISLLGRICTGRLIIPQYDKVFLAPICTVLAGALLPFALVRAGMNPVWGFELSFFAALLLALSLPPKLRDWRLTGPYRIPANVQSTQTRAPDPREQTLSELFSDKSGAAKSL